MSISFDDFKKIEMKVGTIISAEEFPEARKPAYKLIIDFGSGGIKKSSAQITDLYQKEELTGRQVVAVVNFPPKQIANFISECLVLGVNDEDGHVALLKPGKIVPDGTSVY